jgi:hypothetical protein
MYQRQYRRGRHDDDCDARQDAVEASAVVGHNQLVKRCGIRIRFAVKDLVVQQTPVQGLIALQQAAVVAAGGYRPFYFHLAAVVEITIQIFLDFFISENSYRHKSSSL